MKTKKNKHRGGSLDDFLKEEGLYEEVCAAAAKRVLSAQLAEALAAQHKTVSELAREMKTSRAAINRILDEKNYSLSRMARSSGRFGMQPLQGRSLFFLEIPG